MDQTPLQNKERDVRKQINGSENEEMCPGKRKSRGGGSRWKGRWLASIAHDDFTHARPFPAGGDPRRTFLDARTQKRLIVVSAAIARLMRLAQTLTTLLTIS